MGSPVSPAVANIYTENEALKSKYAPHFSRQYVDDAILWSRHRSHFLNFVKRGVIHFTYELENNNIFGGFGQNRQQW